MSDKLKPCPWCKEIPKTQRTAHRLLDGLTLEYWWVQCDNAKCPVMPESLSYNTEDEAIAFWNTCTGELNMHMKNNTRYHVLFGTPERAAVTLVRTSDERAVCKLPTWTASSNDYEAWLDWLRGDAE